MPMCPPRSDNLKTSRRTAANCRCEAGKDPPKTFGPKQPTAMKALTHRSRRENILGCATQFEQPRQTHRRSRARSMGRRVKLEPSHR